MHNPRQIRIRGLYLSPGHNYRGHHGRPPGRHQVLEPESLTCMAGRGLVGDRYFDHKENYKGQITFFAWEVYQDLCRRLQVWNKSPAVFRRNVVVEQVDLNELIGARFTVQDIEFEGVEECRPCYWMDQAFAPGAEEALRDRGGLRARILSDGVLRCDHSPCLLKTA